MTNSRSLEPVSRSAEPFRPAAGAAGRRKGATAKGEAVERADASPPRRGWSPWGLTHDQLELLPMPAYICNASGAIIDYNRRAVELWGRAPRSGDRRERYCGFGRTLRPDGVEITRDEMPVARALKSGEPCREVELQGERTDQSRVSFFLNVMPLLDHRRHLVGALACMQDITEWKQAATAQFEARKMAALGRFTANVVHDYCNVLAAVTNNLELVKRRIGKSPALKFVLGARQSADRGLEITDRLHAFARVQHMICKATDVTALLADLQPELEEICGDSVRVECPVMENLWPAFVDGKQVERALCQLVANARDAMADGGKLTVATGNLRLRVRDAELAAGEYVVVSIIDTGCGMDAETLARAFEPFFTTKRGGKNSGLGLCVVLGIAQQLGGGVRIDSCPGQGTRVNLYLPHAEAPAAETAKPKTASHARAEDGNESQRETALVVDPDPGMRAVASEGLDSCGFAVIDANSGFTASEIIRSDRTVKLLVVDCGTAQVQGLEALQQAHAVHPDMGLLVITDYPDLPGPLAAWQGKASVLRKPFTQMDLAAAVKRASVKSEWHERALFSGLPQ